MSTPTAHKLLVTPRSAALTIVADPALRDDYHVDSEGDAPIVRERDDALEIRYSPGWRVRGLSMRRRSLTVALSPRLSWAIELRGGVSRLHADLRDLEISEIEITGGSTDLVLDLPSPTEVLAVHVFGGVRGAVVRRPRAIPVSVAIVGGASDLRLDDSTLGSSAGTVCQQAAGKAYGDAQIGLLVFGGAKDLTVEATR